MNSGKGTDKDSNLEINELLTASLDQRVESIDAVTSAKLSAARHRALEQSNSPGLWGLFSPWKSGFAVLSICVLAMSLWLNDNDPTQPPSIAASEQSNMLADLEILASKDGVEFYESLDFLIWLENAPENSG